MAGCTALGAGVFALASGDGGGAATAAQSREDGDERRWGDRDFPRPGRFGPHLRFHRPSAADIREHSEQIRERREEYAKQLGEELGKSADEVLDAQRAVFKEKLDEAVKDENLTQKQADRILECYDSAKCGPIGFGGAIAFGGGGFGFGGAPHIDPPPLPRPPQLPGD